MSTWSSLKIELIATGDQANVWGTTTNNNLQFALQEAITGSGTVTFASNNQTISLIDSNLTQTARNLRLNLTGVTGGSTRNLFIPAIQKQYIVYNGCADSVLITNGTSPTPTGTGVTVPAGRSLIVFNDGTNVTPVITYAPSMTLGAALPVGSGGTGLTSFTANGAFYADGTGAAITTGTLPVISGGTGLTTYTGNGALYANGAGTAITSGTLPIASGGTGQTTANAALNALLPSQTLNNGKFLTTNGSNTTWADNPLGTVTNVSVVSSNGLAGTVANPTTTPALTLSTTVTGVLKGNGTAISAAVSSVDYAPATTGSTILAGNGSGGFSNLPTATTGVLQWNGSAYVWTTNYAPATTGSTILAGNGSGGFTNLPSPSAGFLQWNGSAYVWNGSAGTGSVTSVNVLGGLTGLTTSGGPVTTSGSITLGGTLNPASGGTGQTSYTDGQLLIGNSTGNTLAKSTLTAGTGVTITNGAGSITISAAGLGGDVVGPASATDNAFARFDTTSGKLIKNSVATLDNTGSATFAGSINVSGTAASAADLKLYEDTDNGVNYVSFKAPALVPANVTWVLPNADGTNGNVLITDGSGTLTWGTVNSGASLSNDITTATNLYPMFANATTGTPTTVYTSNSKLLYKPSTGELQASELIASNGIIANNTTISTSYTVATGTNAMSVGPITIASGQAVTVSSGQRWIVL